MSKVGYGVPPKETQFQPGQSGNPGGKSSEQRRLEIENAERATRLHNRMLAALENELAEAEEAGDHAAIKMINMNILRLLKDAQDRGLGQPEQLVDHRSRDKSMTPQTITRQIVDPKPDD